MYTSSIILIGMPSAGKSTVGKLLSQKTGMRFIDTDLLILEQEKKPLKNIVNEDGLEKFLEIQQNVIKSLNTNNSIIATGGSVIYSNSAMNHLKTLGKTIFLKQNYDEIMKRTALNRRFARQKEQNMLDLYNERMPLYEKYADITIECSNKEPEEISSEINNKINIEF